MKQAFTSIALIVLVLTPGGAMGRGNPPLQLNDSNLVVEASFVENQPGATNPTGCFWTFDDNWQAFGSGYLDAGVSLVRSHCLIADWTPHQLGITVTAPSPSLVITFHYDPWGVEFVVPARLVGNGFEYRGCVIGPRWSLALDLLPEVSGANGGRGSPASITITVANPTGKRIGKIDAGFEFGSAGVLPRRQALCQDHPPDEFTIDGYVWGSRL